MFSAKPAPKRGLKLFHEYKPFPVGALTWNATSVTREDEPKELKIGSKVYKLGHEFYWSRLHLKHKDYAPRRTIGDLEMDTLLSTLKYRTIQNRIACNYY
eukprot:m.177906 g.177906  ORF g.177906 m.177906 type:complete len:100 (+) comp15462_c1_seq4:217-516(+)